MIKYELERGQLAALNKCDFRERFGYFLEPGLGKTLLCLHEAQLLYNEGKIDAVLVICPYTLVSNWAEESEEKFKFSFKVIKFPSSKQPMEKGCIAIINYEQLIYNAGAEIEGWLQKYRVYVIFDESVQLKNHNTDRWRKVRSWHHSAAYVRLLSGRPQVQSPMDLWPQLRLLKADVNSSPFAYRARFCKMGGFKMKQVVGVYNQDELSAILDSCSIFCSKKEYSKIPGKHYMSIGYELSTKQRSTYREMLKDMVTEVSGHTISVLQAAHKYGKLQQISSGFAFDTDEKSVHWIESFNKTSKFKALLEIIEKTEDKVVISAHFRPTIDALIGYFKCPKIIGGMTDEEIILNKEEFNNGNSKIIVLQPAAGKYGHTLLGNKDVGCSTMVYYESSFNLDDRLQSEDRIHRIGQNDSCIYYDFVGTAVEKSVIKRLRHKDVLSADILGIALNDAWHNAKL